MTIYKMSRLVLAIAVLYLSHAAPLRANSACQATLPSCGSAPEYGQCMSSCGTVAANQCDGECMWQCGSYWYGTWTAACTYRQYAPLGPNFYVSNHLYCDCD